MIDALRSTIWQLFCHKKTSLVCIVSLAIGVSLITSTGSIVDHALLQPPPFHDADRLMMLRTENVEYRFFDEQTSMMDFFDWEQDCETMDLTAFNLGRIDLPYEGGFQRLLGLYVSPSFFDVMQIQPYLGSDLRDFDRTGHAKQIMLSPEVWRNHLAADPSKIGNVIPINSWASYPNPGSLSYQLAGLLPENLRCIPSRTAMVDDRGTGIDRNLDFIMPIHMMRGRFSMRRFRGVDAMGRLKPGVSVEAAQAEMDVICSRLSNRFADSNEGWRVRVVPMKEYLSSDIRPFVMATMLAAFLVFLIATTNVVHMLVVQYQQRQGEMAIRAAVGASPISLSTQVILEFGALVGTGFGLGIAVASFVTPALLRMAPEKLRWLPTELSLNAVLFAGLVMVCAGLFIWTMALRKVVSPNLQQLLGNSGRTASANRSTERLLGWMTQVQLVATYCLLLAAGVLWFRIQQLNSVDPGFDAKNRLSMAVSLPAAKYEWNHNSVFNQAVVDRLKDTPGVEDAAVILGMPMGNNPLSARVTVEGRPLIRPGDIPEAFIRVISDDYFATMGIPLIRGRTFEPPDKIGEIAVTRVAIVSQSLADRCWPDMDPVGRRFKPFKESHWMEVVGVVGDVHSAGVDRASVIDIYYPEKLFPQSSPNLIVRTQSEPMSMAARVRKAILSVDSDAIITNVRTMESVIIDSQAERYFGLRLLSVLSLVGLVLAISGIIATAVHTVSSRKDEFMVRVACGATPTHLVAMVVGQQIRLVAIALTVAVILGAMVAPTLQLDWADRLSYRNLALFVVPCLLAIASVSTSFAIALKSSLRSRIWD